MTTGAAARIEARLEEGQVPEENGELRHLLIQTISAKKIEPSLGRLTNSGAIPGLVPPFASDLACLFRISRLPGRA